MFYCVETIYYAGGNISCHWYTVHSIIKPEDQEVEELHHVTIRRYFNLVDDAIKYVHHFEKI